MTLLPPKRPKVRSGITRAPCRAWPRHRKWLRSHCCVVMGCNGEPIEVSHLRTAANSGVGIKPRDDSAVPMCVKHHRIYHNLGHDSFERAYHLDLFALAEAFTVHSPDKVMRESIGAMQEGELAHDRGGK